MPAIASLEDLKAAQKDLLGAKDLDELKTEALGKHWGQVYFVCITIIRDADAGT